MRGVNLVPGCSNERAENALYDDHRSCYQTTVKFHRKGITYTINRNLYTTTVFYRVYRSGKTNYASSSVIIFYYI